MASLVPEWYTGPPSLYAGVPIERALGPRGSREEFRNAQQMRLASYFFPAARPKALVVLVHGHGCSIQHEYLNSKEPGKPAQYQGSLVERLNAAGISAAGIDMQGCGHSEGIRCYVAAVQHHVDEVRDFTRELEASGREGFAASLPRFVLGDSLGGFLAVELCRQTDLFRGAVLIAPMLSLEKVSKSGLNPYLRPVAGIISWLLPTLQVAKTERSPLNPEIQAFFDKDPQMWHGWTRARNAHEYLLATEALCARMHELAFPFLCLHGSLDTMTDADGSRRLHELSQSKDKTLVIREGRWHVLLKEPGHEEVWALVVDWISARAADRQ